MNQCIKWMEARLSPRLRQWLWFIGLWCFGLACVSTLGMVIRWAMGIE